MRPKIDHDKAASLVRLARAIRRAGAFRTSRGRIDRVLIAAGAW